MGFATLTRRRRLGSERMVPEIDCGHTGDRRNMPHYGVPASIALGRCRGIAQLQRQTVQPTALITLEDTESDSLHPLPLRILPSFRYPESRISTSSLRRQCITYALRFRLILTRRGLSPIIPFFRPALLKSMRLSARRLSFMSSAILLVRSWSRRRDLLCFFK